MAIPVFIQPGMVSPGRFSERHHEYATLDYQRVIDALDQLQPVEDFVEAVRWIERDPELRG